MSYFDDNDDIVSVNLEDGDDDQQLDADELNTNANMNFEVDNVVHVNEQGTTEVNNDEIILDDNINNDNLNDNNQQIINEPLNNNIINENVQNNIDVNNEGQDLEFDESEIMEEMLDFDESEQAYNKFELDDNNNIQPINPLLANEQDIENYCRRFGINETALKTIIKNRIDMASLSRSAKEKLNENIDLSYETKLDSRGHVVSTDYNLGEFSKYANVSIDDFKTGDFYKGTKTTGSTQFTVQNITVGDFVNGVNSVFDNNVKNYNMLSRQELNARNMVVGTTEDEYLDGHKKPTIKSDEIEPLDTSKLSYEDIQRINNSKNSIVDLDDAVDTYRANQDRAMALLLGEGNPINANISVLDKEALKKGAYKYDLKAIKEFEKAINISDDQIKDRAASNSTFDSLTIAIESTHDKLMVRNRIETDNAVNRNDMQIEYMLSFADNLRKAESIYNKTSFFKKLFSPFSAYKAWKAINEKKEKLRDYVGEHAANEFLNSTPNNREKATEYLRRATVATLFPDRIKSALKKSISNKVDKYIKDTKNQIDDIKKVIDENNKQIETIDKEIKQETVTSFKANKEVQNKVFENIQKTFDSIIDKNSKNKIEPTDLNKYVSAVTLVSSLEKLGIECPKEVADGKEFAGIFINNKFGKENIEKEMLNSANGKSVPLDVVGNNFNYHTMLQGTSKKVILENINLFEQGKVESLDYKKGLYEEKKNKVSADVDKYVENTDLKQALQNDYNNFSGANYSNERSDYFAKENDLSAVSPVDKFSEAEVKQFNDLAKSYKQKIFNKDLKDVFEKKDPSKVGQVKVKAQVLDMNKDFKK